MTKKNQELDKFLNSLPIAIFEIIYDRTKDISKFNYVNEAAKKLFSKMVSDSSLSSEFLLGKIMELDEQHQNAKDAFEKIQKLGQIEIKNKEYLLTTLAGKKIVVLASFTANLIDEMIIIKGSICEKSEIIEQDFPKTKIDYYKSIEEEVENLKGFFDTFDAIIMLLNEEGVIQFISPNVGDDILYRPRDEVIGRKLESIFPKGQAEFFYKQFQEAIMKGEAVDFEYHLPIQDKVKWFQSRIIPVHIKNGRFMQVIAVIRDITKWRVKSIEKMSE
ncbi:MAG: PAS domain-containing protein [Candidatus Heimdallarchaeota archaeon]